MKLYELTTEVRSLLSQLDGSGEALLPEAILSEDEIKARLDLFEGQFDFKAEQIAKMILELSAGITAYNDEVDRLNKHIVTLTNSKNSLLSYLKLNMEDVGKLKIKGDLVTITIRLNPASLEILDESQIPEQWWRIPPVPEKVVNKKAIIDNFRATGEIVPGTKVVNATRVEIK